MSWRTEKTKQGQDLVWEGAELGVASSPTRGTANLQNVNIATELGEVAASFGRVNQAQANIVDGTLTPDGATLFDAPSTLNSGAWIQVTASTVSGITAATNPTTLDIDYLIVAGGGGGGSVISSSDATAGGGGGGGEVKEDSDNLSVGKYTVVVGTGGASATAGNDSSIDTIYTATGGGAGGRGSTININGGNGGNGGGGGAREVNPAVFGTGGTGVLFDGGDGFADIPSSGDAAGGGGGGSGGDGGNGNGTGSGGTAGNGGIGVASSITGSSVTYGGGGGGGSQGTAGTGGTGGGGNGGKNAAGSDGTDGLGGGGGGGSQNDSSGAKNGGEGGAGVVIISYVTGSAVCTGGTITHVGTNTIHTFLESGVFEVVWINPGGLYYVSFKNTSNKIKLSDHFDPYGTDPLTHGTTGTITFSLYGVFSGGKAKATENYNTATGTEYRYYILDENGLVFVYDTQVYRTTLASNGVGVTWMLPDPVDYSTAYILNGMDILNGMLAVIALNAVLVKPTVNLGGNYLIVGYTMNPFPTHTNFALAGTQGKLYWTDNQYIGQLLPTTSLITSEANIQSYAEYTASATTGTITELINGSVPYLTSGTRVPVVFFTDTEGTLPTAISENTVYYIDYDPATETFEAYAASTGGSALNIETGATGNQFFNTFWPFGQGAYNGEHPLCQFEPQRMNLPFYEQATSLVEIGNTILIGCEGTTIYPWNQIDPIPSDVIELPEAYVKTMINVNNLAYIFAGNKGNIYISNNSVASLVTKIPDYCAGVPGTPSTYIEPRFTWGDAMYARGRVYCSILDQTSAKAGNCGGVWSFIPSENFSYGQETGIALRLENQNSYGDYDGMATLLIPNQQQNAIGTQYWATWQDSYSLATSSVGIDNTSTVPVTSYVIETDLLQSGTNLDKTTFSQVEYNLTSPLATSESIQLYYRLNSTAAWTSCGTVREETNNRISGYFPVNFEKTQWTQLRAVATLLGTAQSSYGRLKNLRLR